MQDAANDLTTATRFGRMDMALERVNRERREEFMRKHAGWGSAIRIADCDLSGLRLLDKEHAAVTLTVSWQRIDETDLRGTQIAQKWQDHHGRWLLESEERIADAPFHRYTDFYGLTEIRLKFGHAFQIAEHRRTGYAGEPVKSAFVSDWVIGLGIARMYAALMEGAPIEVRAFRSRDAAAEWLAVPVDILRPNG